MLASLRASRGTFEESNPEAIFDITEKQATNYFYIIRNLIRRNDEALSDDIRFLLEIPAVKALVHTDVTPGEENELLRLALSVENQNAAEILLTIPAVRALAQQNDYYREEQSGRLDLAQLSRDMESSMTALTAGEQKRLEAVTDRYQPIIAEEGVDKIMERLRNQMEEHYKNHPATIMINDKQQTLPFEWKEFQELNLTDTDRKKALEAYYENPSHTAWRYLAKPNHWMSEHASYVYISDARTERWSTFEDYQPLIAMLYVAAQDKDIKPTDDYTLETRVEGFIDELAHIGRAHNWDDFRDKVDEKGETVKNAKGETVLEQYDDKEGDRPSCFSGVKRRLFQSVRGHPLLMMLTKEGVEQELNKMIWDHFKDAITPDLRDKAKEALETYAVEIDDTPSDIMAILKKLDITDEEKKQFIDKMTIEYGKQFTEDQSFMKAIDNAIALTVKDPPSHLLKFYGQLNLDKLLSDSLSPESDAKVQAKLTEEKEAEVLKYVEETKEAGEEFKYDKETSDDVSSAMPGINQFGLYGNKSNKDDDRKKMNIENKQEDKEHNIVIKKNN